MFVCLQIQGPKWDVRFAKYCLEELASEKNVMYQDKVKAYMNACFLASMVSKTSPESLFLNGLFW